MKKKKVVDEKTMVDETIKKLLNLLGLEDSFEASLQEETIEITLNTQDVGIVVGYHGEVLDALQLVFSLCLSKKLGRFIHVSIEVGDYKKKRTDYLKNLALQTKERVLQEGREFSISSLKPWERRIVHLFLQDDKEVASESVGEGKDRTLIIKPLSSPDNPA